MAAESLLECRALDTEQYWKQLMQQGNALLEQDDVVGALVSYEQACILARSHPELWIEIEDALAALVESHLRYCKALMRAHRIEEVSVTLCGLHVRLLRLADDTELSWAARRSALRHLGQTTAALERFQGLHGVRPEMQRALHSSRAACVVSTSAIEPTPKTLH